MRDYVNSAALQEYTTKLVAKLKTLFPGTPTAVATVAEMTDHNKTYVYVGTETGYTAGDWYYWDGSAWTSGGPFQATSIITDTTLAVAGEAADAKATGDAIAAAKAAVLNAMAPAYSTSATYAVGDYVNYNGAIYRCTTAISTAEAWTAGHWTYVALGSDLEDQVSALKTHLQDDTIIVKGVGVASFTSGKAIIYNTGEYATVSDPTLCGSDYVEIKDGSEKLTCPMCNALNSTNRGVAFYDDQKTYISGVRENYNTTAATYDVRTLDIPDNAKYVRFSYYTDDSSVSHPSFFAYTDLSTDNQFADVRSKLISTSKVTPANLFNPDDPDVLLNHKIDHQGNITEYNGLAVSGYIPCEEGLHYTFPVYTNHFGGNARYIACYNANKEWVDASTGTVTDGINDLTIKTYKNIKYFRVCVCTLDVNSNFILTPYHSWSNFMIVPGNSIPDRFVPYVQQSIMDTTIYSGHEGINNPLYGKKAVFVGDSICEGGDVGGWAKQIGIKNTMLWENAGIGGSTISDIPAVNKTICTRTITMSDPDYIILEGGTNDADRIGDATGETKPVDFGTWDPDEYGTDDAATYYGFDVTTFCGAVDYMCKRFVGTYPGAKIGFIGAQKMGTVAATRKNRGYYIKTAMEICKKWGISCINLWDGCYLNPMIPSHYTSGEDYMYIDGQHLTEKGYDYISPMIDAWMKTL